MLHEKKKKKNMAKKFFSPKRINSIPFSFDKEHESTHEEIKYLKDDVFFAFSFITHTMRMNGLNKKKTPWRKKEKKRKWKKKLPG